MKVLYLACDPRIKLTEIAGHTTHILKTIQALETKGHDVTKLIAGERSAAQHAKETFTRVKFRLPSIINIALRDSYALLHDRRFLKYCRHVCNGAKFDFIYERAAPYHWTGQRLRKRLRIPLILEVNSPLEELITLHGCSRGLIPIAAYIERSTARNADAIVVGSAGMKNYLVNKGVRRDRIFTIYPTADDCFFSPAKRRDEIRSQFGIDGKLVVGFVGSMAPYQRVDLLLRAAVEVRRASQGVHFLIVGDGAGMAALKRLVTDDGLEDFVTFTGRVPYDEMPEYCGAMDVCVIPHATWYGAPTKLFEYAASGKPIIAASVEPIQELIRDGENGLLFKVGDVEGLATKILLMAASPGIGENLGRQLRQEVQREHNWSRNTDKLMEIFDLVKRQDRAQAQNLI